MNHTVQMIPFPREACQALRVPAGTSGLFLTIVAISSRKQPTYYQEVFIPPNDFKLHISDSAFIPECWS
jgi:DNA-binding GntR family transcriptional regulator